MPVRIPSCLWRLRRRWHLVCHIQFLWLSICWYSIITISGWSVPCWWKYSGITSGDTEIRNLKKESRKQEGKRMNMRWQCLHTNYIYICTHICMQTHIYPTRFWCFIFKLSMFAQADEEEQQGCHGKTRSKRNQDYLCKCTNNPLPPSRAGMLRDKTAACQLWDANITYQIQAMALTLSLCSSCGGFNNDTSCIQLNPHPWAARKALCVSERKREREISTCSLLFPPVCNDCCRTACSNQFLRVANFHG